MVVRALTRKLLRELWRLRAPGIAVALVVAAGLATFDMSYSTLAALSGSRDAFYEEHRFADVFARVRRAPLPLLRQLREIPGVAAADARIVSETTVEVPGFDEPVTARLQSLHEGESPLNAVHLRSGRLPEPSRDDETLVSEGFATAHALHEGSSLVALLNGRQQRLTVTGIALSPEHVYAIRPGDVFPDDLRFGVLWMPRDALAAAFDMTGAFNDVALSLAPGASEDDVVTRVDLLLERHGGLGAYGRRDQVSHFYLSGELDQLRAMGRTAPVIFLAVAAFLLHVVLSRLVATQRTQVATLKAFGYGNATVALHYVQLVLAMTLGGVAVGAAAGAWLGRGMVNMYADYYRFPRFDYRLGGDLVLAGLLLATAVGVAATLGAVFRVARLPPAEAMRPEAPPSFRAARLGRHSLAQALSPAARMVLRRLLRRPGKALMSCVGLALAVGILVLSRFAVDAIDFIVDLQFNAAQRDDVAVAFTEPREQGALHDVARLPGVLAAEPHRSVAVRIRSGHVSRRVGLLGVRRDADLHRILEGERATAVPPEGLVLSSKLASILGVREGDSVTLEVLEGERPLVTAPVARVAEQFIGTAATMEIGALNRLLREGPVISGAFLRADPRKLPELYARLRESPAVATVSLRRGAVQSLKKTMDETMLRMTFFNILFAGVIAFGVVFNIARVSLAEQARELATLRVLGLSRGEVSSVLLGELAVLVLLSLPLGLLAGRVLGSIMTSVLDTELYRIPLVVSPRTDGFAVLVVVAAAAASALVVRRQVDRLDMVAVLKAAE